MFAPGSYSRGVLLACYTGIVIPISDDSSEIRTSSKPYPLLIALPSASNNFIVLTITVRSEMGGLAVRDFFFFFFLAVRDGGGGGGRGRGCCQR